MFRVLLAALARPQHRLHLLARAIRIIVIVIIIIIIVNKNY